MNLDQALHIIARIHTADDDSTGFHVRMGATPMFPLDCRESDYVEAWKTIREHLHLRVEADQYPART